MLVSLTIRIISQPERLPDAVSVEPGVIERGRHRLRERIVEHSAEDRRVIEQLGIDANEHGKRMRDKVLRAEASVLLANLRTHLGAAAQRTPHDGGLWSGRHYSNACTGGRSDAPVFGGVAGLVIEPLWGWEGIGLPEIPGRRYVGSLLGAGGPRAGSGSLPCNVCRWAEAFVAVAKVAAIIAATSPAMILFTCISP
jgi:hypothetical protein